MFNPGLHHTTPRHAFLAALTYLALPCCDTRPTCPLHLFDGTHSASGSLCLCLTARCSSTACDSYVSALACRAVPCFCSPYPVLSRPVQDPSIRSSMSLSLSGAVVILDEAHNVEGVCRDAGSLELPLVDMVNMASDLCDLRHVASCRFDILVCCFLLPPPTSIPIVSSPHVPTVCFVSVAKGLSAPQSFFSKKSF